LDDGPPLPDPASRFQPLGPEGPSQVIDPKSFSWTDDIWKGVLLPGQVLYEMHVGTFTPEGTWAAATCELAELARLGVTLLEIMPVADWPGQFGWGYDGVCLFAPTRLYGRPDEFRAFVDQAHRVGIGVLLDVVYNHFGNHGCSVQQFSRDYISGVHANEWGAPVNFDGPGSGPVREFYLANARYWIEEFHLDGYRVDATQAIFDDSPEHILAQVTATARAAAGGRSIVMLGESEPQDTRIVRPIASGGFGMEALWNDDFHHSAMVRLTGSNEAYYSDYQGSANEFIALLKWGFLYQGQYYSWQKTRRGTPAFDLEPSVFVHYLQNHDQVANSASGARIDRLTSPARLRAMTALLLLMPETPLLFQGQEFSASTPFCFFLDSSPDQAPQVSEGRARFLSQFPSLALPESRQRLPDPVDPRTFRACKLKFEERETHRKVYALHKDLLRLRRTDPLVSAQHRDRIDAGAVSPDAFVVRYFDDQDEDRLLVVNFGIGLHFNPAPQPLLAPPLNRQWQIVWSSEDPRYGGSGTPSLDTDDNWRIPGEATVLLGAVSRSSTKS
jgi:maltooligosyltrehalose trehalohydrolase